MTINDLLIVRFQEAKDQDMSSAGPGLFSAFAERRNGPEAGFDRQLRPEMVLGGERLLVVLDNIDTQLSRKSDTDIEGRDSLRFLFNFAWTILVHFHVTVSALQDAESIAELRRLLDRLVFTGCAFVDLI